MTLPVTGNVKLQWKPDFGALGAFHVDFEMYGKDHSTKPRSMTVFAKFGPRET